MGESSNKRVVIVGIFIFLGIAILITGILTIGNLKNTFSSKIRLTTQFEDVNGLLPGGNVWFSGVKIGSVKKLQFLGNSKVEVIMNIDQDAQRFIRKNAKVKISTDGLIGNKILVITGGDLRAEQVEEGDMLAAEKTLSTEDMMNTFQQSNRNLVAITSDLKTITGKMARGEGSLSRIINEDDVYDNVKSTSASLKTASGKTQNLMASLSSLGYKMNKKGSLVNSIATDTVTYDAIKATVSRLSTISDSISGLVNNLKQASSDPNSPVGVLLHDKATGDYLKSTIKNLESSSIKLDQDLEALQHNFLLRRYFKKQAKKKEEEQKK